MQLLAAATLLKLAELIAGEVTVIAWIVV